MNMHEQLVVTPTAWANGAGNDTDVVVSSRIRLARNFAAQRFPNKQDREEAMQVWKHLSDFATDHPTYHFYRLDDADALDKDALLAKHLISPAHAAKDERLRALVLSDDLSQAVMVNEEDHLRMQTFRRGFDLGDAWQSATLLDDQIASYGDYAFTDRLGYLKLSNQYRHRLARLGDASSPCYDGKSSNRALAAGDQSRHDRARFLWRRHRSHR